MRIILIVSDTFRFDYVGVKGLKKVSTPEIDSFISDSVFFDRFYADSFPTVPHRYDMYTGIAGFPHRGWERLGDKDITLAEIFLDYGYVTQLITDTANLLRRGLNYDRGYLGYYLTRGQERDICFTKMNEPIPYTIPLEKTRSTTYFQDHAQVDVSQWINNDWIYEEDRFVARTMTLSEKWLERNYKTEDFFLHIDTFDPHEPWDPPEFYVSKYADSDYRGIPMIYPNYGPADIFTAAELANMEAHYAAKVEMTSKWIGNFIRKTKDIGIYNDSLIIFTSDHGTYLGEHNRTGKINIFKGDERGPWPLYEELIRAPLAIKLPGQSHAGKKINSLIRVVDIFPTLLDAAGISLDKKLPGQALLPEREVLQENPGVVVGRIEGLNPIEGKSLMPLIKGQEDKLREMIFSSAKIGRVGGATSGPMPVNPEAPDTVNWITITGEKYTMVIGGRRNEKPQLFDLENDPQQQDDIYEENRELARRMAQGLFEYLKYRGVEDGLLSLYKSKIELP